jgi:hypothetical protein
MQAARRAKAGFARRALLGGSFDGGYENNPFARFVGSAAGNNKLEARFSLLQEPQLLG